MIALGIDRRHALAGLVAAVVAPRSLATAARPWKWAVDYSANTDPALARQFDLLVLEPDHRRPIAPLRGPTSQLLGYISLGEVEQNRSYAGALRKAGVLRMANPNWPDARLIDLRKPEWTALVTERLVPEILAMGYDGIFLDTLDNAEAMEHARPVAQSGMIAAACELVRQIRARFPAITIMMNRGYALLPAVATQVDIVLGEAMASRWDFAAKQYVMTTDADWNWQAARLRAARAVNPTMRLAVLDYWDPADPATIAALYARERDAGFCPYVATIALDRLHPEKGA